MLLLFRTHLCYAAKLCHAEVLKVLGVDHDQSETRPSDTLYD